MRAKHLLKFAQKKDNPDEATLKECARIAKRDRHHVWEGPPALPKKGFFGNSPIVALLKR